MPHLIAGANGPTCSQLAGYTEVADLTHCYSLSSPWSCWAGNSKEQRQQSSSTSAVSGRSRTRAGKSVSAHRKDELPHLPSQNKTAKIRGDHSPTLVRDVCTHPRRKDDSCLPPNSFRLLLWWNETLQEDSYNQISQQNRDLFPNSRTGIETILNKFKCLFNGASYY